MSAALKLPDNDVDIHRASLLHLVTCGSVDDGKSTLLGRLLFDSHAVLDDQLTALDRDSKRFGTQGDARDFALLVDGLSAEREQGITIDIAYRYFSTPNRSFILADAPGHEQYTRNMATGASKADLAIILIDARKGVLPQTRRHSYIVSMLGVRHVVLAVNKMDLVGFSPDVYRQIVTRFHSWALDRSSRSPSARARATISSPIPTGRHGTKVRPCWSTWKPCRSNRRKTPPEGSGFPCSMSTAPTRTSAAMPAPSPTAWCTLTNR
jgi:small GTP-binding protein